MNRIESAATRTTLDPHSDLAPLVAVEPLSCAVAVWRAVTRAVTADRAAAEREFARAIHQGTPDINIGFHPAAAEAIHNAAAPDGASVLQLLHAVETHL
jgi:hypothetical protein